ncbi:MAG TPA: cytochrome c oxidase subunit 3 [Hyphomicrobium sp.]|nr:cytochrome c oxidase subunit 3 [Hyphomicrobium sp.]
MNAPEVIVKKEDDASVLDELPGDLMMWVLIISEILVFGAALLAFLAVRATSPAVFLEGQAQLNPTAGALNTAVLVTSGMLAARALALRRNSQRSAARLSLLGAGALGVVFLLVKWVEYGAEFAKGIGIESSPFFTFYFLITGFHALHVVAGIVILGIIARWDSIRNIETGIAFWHMVDLVWVLLFPIIYLLK